MTRSTQIIDEIHDHMCEPPARLPESLAETATALALLKIAGSLEKIATALATQDRTEA